MRRARWQYRVMMLLALYVFVGTIVPATRARPDRVVAVAAVVLVCFAVRRAFGVGVRPEPDWGGGHRELDGADEQDVRLARLDASLARAAESGEQYARSTVPMLRRLTAERLRDKTGIDVAADPSGARRLMGEELWEIFSTEARPDAPPPGADRLALLVGKLERL